MEIMVDMILRNSKLHRQAVLGRPLMNTAKVQGHCLDGQELTERNSGRM